MGRKVKKQIYLGVEHIDVIDSFREEHELINFTESEVVQLLLLDYKRLLKEKNKKDKSNFFISKEVSLILTMVSSLMKEQEVPLEDKNDVLQYHQALKKFEKELGQKTYQKKKIPKNIQEQLKEKKVQESLEGPLEKKIMPVEEVEVQTLDQTPEQMRQELVRKGYIRE